MPTQPAAFVCALATACILFSCNSKKSKTGIVSNVLPAKQSDTVTPLPDAAIDIRAYYTDFIEKAIQQFTAAAQKISVITAKKGLKLTVNPSVLEKEDGSPVDGKINVSIIELTSSNDLFKSSAATVSDGRLLASGGSYFIGMECNGQKLRIKKGMTMQVDFPVLKNDEMKLFYGERDSKGIMNWKETGKGLQQDYEKISFRSSPDFIPQPLVPVLEHPAINIKYCLFNSMDSKVYFLNRFMTIRELVANLRSRGIERVVDTVYYNWYGKGTNVVYSTENLPGGYLHGRQYRMISPSALSREKDSLATASCVAKDSYDKAYSDYTKAYEEYKKKLMKEKETASFTDQLKKYYAPATIGALGWLNCDRFYQGPGKTDVNLDIPITLNNSRIEYFVIFRSFNGLINERIDFNAQTKMVLKNLPIGELVTLVAFSKSKGIIYAGKQDFTVQKNTKVPVPFKIISREELGKMFGNNVKA